ncbi:MAG TPA: hypothetical protein VFJ94_15040 [Intrasporangium sp.]|uniref:hypothetical protein n=1 Tax=Intrasporangium sp. TaxID=1925024 RepID=UPI002D77BD25|nr:hypothetical protein [Intrasporangium sp.]HET7399831.1 hypothetical protein [Intrasporangium sp.]
MTSAAVITGLAGALVSAVIVAVLIPQLRRRGVLDLPAGRSLHSTAVPRGGGIGIVAAVLIAPSLGLALSPDRSGLARLLLAWAPIVSFGAVGLADDFFSLRPQPRLVAQAALAVAGASVAVAAAGRSPMLVLLLVLAQLALVNLTNFMDGANGLVSGHAAVASAWYVVVAARTGEGIALLLAAALLGAALGFLPFNVPRARVFLGDVGSYVFGASWAAVGVLLLFHGARAEAVLAPLLLIGTDAGVTVARRIHAGDRIFEPHRLHVYQRLVHAGWSHTAVAAVFAGTTALLCLLALPALVGAARPWRVAMLAVMLAVATAYVSLPRLVGTKARWAQVRSEVGA